MLLIPSYLVALITFLAGSAWIAYARAQSGRFHARAFPWLGVPFFFVTAFYIWITIQPVEIAVRAIYAEYSIVSIALPQAIILFLLSLKTWGTHGKH